MLSIVEEIYREIPLITMSLRDSSQDFIGVMGQTGSGKSTLIGYLLGKKIKFSKVKQNFHISYENPSDEQLAKQGKLPVIGNSSTSCTELALSYEDAQGHCFYDFAGFFDSKGSKQQILNGVSTSMVFKEGCQVRLIIAIQTNSIGERRGGFFIELAELLKRTFQEDFESVITSSMLVITKTNHKNEVKSEYAQFAEEIINEPTTSSATKFLLASIFRNNRFHFFSTPYEGSEQQISEIKKCVLSISPTYLTANARSSLTDRAIMDVKNMQSGIQASIKQNLSLLFDFVDRQYLKNKSNMDKKYEKISKCQTLLKSGAQLKKSDAEIISPVLSCLQVENQLKTALINNCTLLDFCKSIDKSAAEINIVPNIASKLKVVKQTLNLEITKNLSEAQLDNLKKQLKKADEQHEASMKRQLRRVQERNEEKIRQINKKREQIKAQYAAFENDLSQKKQLMEKQYIKKKREVEEKERQAAEIKKSIRERQEEEYKITVIKKNPSQSQNGQKYQSAERPGAYIGKQNEKRQDGINEGRKYPPIQRLEERQPRTTQSNSKVLQLQDQKKQYLKQIRRVQKEINNV